MDKDDHDDGGCFTPDCPNHPIKPTQTLQVNNHVRYWEGGFRKATCSICWCLIGKSNMDAHAIYHVERGEGHAKRSGAYGAHNDYTVLRDADRIYTVKTGWVTEATGPR